MKIYNGKEIIFDGQFGNEDFFEDYFRNFTAFKTESDEDCDYASIACTSLGYKLLEECNKSYPEHKFRKGFYFWSNDTERLVSDWFLSSLLMEATESA